MPSKYACQICYYSKWLNCDLITLRDNNEFCWLIYVLLSEIGYGDIVDNIECLSVVYYVSHISLKIKFGICDNVSYYKLVEAMIWIFSTFSLFIFCHKTSFNNERSANCMHALSNRSVSKRALGGSLNKTLGMSIFLASHLASSYLSNHKFSF